VLLVGVDGDGDRTFDTEVRDAIHRVVTRPAAADYQQARVGDTELAQLLIQQCCGRATPHIVGQFVHQLGVACSASSGLHTFSGSDGETSLRSCMGSQ